MLESAPPAQVAKLVDAPDLGPSKSCAFADFIFTGTNAGF
jgi:hypothetical protein